MTESNNEKSTICCGGCIVHTKAKAKRPDATEYVGRSKNKSEVTSFNFALWFVSGLLCGYVIGLGGLSYASA